MRVFLALAAIAAFLLGMFAVMNTRSDIQIIVALVSFASAVIFIALGVILGAMDRLERRIDEIAEGTAEQ